MACHPKVRMCIHGLQVVLAVVLIGGLPHVSAQPSDANNHRDLTYFVGTDGQPQPIQSVADWQLRRTHILNGLQQAMGALPDRTALGPVQYQVLTEVHEEKYTLKKLELQVGHGDKLLAWLLVPKLVPTRSVQDEKKCSPEKPNGEPSFASNNYSGNTENSAARSNVERLPAVIALHQTNGRLGKDEVAGLAGSENLQYGRELAERGYVVLAPDYPSLGEYKYDFEADQFDSGSMKGIWNHMRCVDLLCSLDNVNPNRIGAVGHSLGGHNAIFLAVFDERIRATISSCGWTPFHDYYGGKLVGWSGERYMPRIENVYHLDPDQVPFDFYELVAAIAPRGFFSSSPTRDDNFEVNGVRKAIAEAHKIYKLHDAADQLQVRYPDSQHDFPTETRREAYRYLDKWLATPASSRP
jgi:Prolyl oligopeptidase family